MAIIAFLNLVTIATATYVLTVQQRTILALREDLAKYKAAHATWLDVSKQHALHVDELNRQIAALEKSAEER